MGFLATKSLKLRGNSTGRISNIGLNESAYFKQLEVNTGWDGIYYGKSDKQYFINNLGYLPDYYEPNLNIVVEYDEPRHYRFNKLIEKDIIRMNRIKEHLKCRFLRYNEYTKELKEY